VINLPLDIISCETDNTSLTNTMLLMWTHEILGLARNNNGVLYN